MSDEQQLQKELADQRRLMNEMIEDILVMKEQLKELTVIGNLCKSAHNDMKWCVGKINQLEKETKELLTNYNKLKQKLNEVIRKWSK